MDNPILLPNLIYASAQLVGGARYDAFLRRSAVQVHGASQLFWDILLCKVGIVLSAAFRSTDNQEPIFRPWIKRFNSTLLVDLLAHLQTLNLFAE